MQELIKKHWNYVLFKNNNELILSVVCGTVGLYDVKITLDPKQTALYNESGEEYINRLAQEIRNNPEKYK